MQEFESPTGHHWHQVVKGKNFNFLIEKNFENNPLAEKISEIFEAIITKLHLEQQQIYCQVYLISPFEMKKINKIAYPAKESSDVLALPAGAFFAKKEHHNFLGEVFINYKKAVQGARDYGHSLLRELSYLMVHGLLHLLNYDHQMENDKKLMFGLTEEILKKCGIFRT